MVKIIRSGKFEKMLEELLVTTPDLTPQINERIKIFKKNPKDTRLRNHQLIGKMAGQNAFSITGDIRIIYKVTGKNTVCFLAIGSHEKVYP